MTPVDQLVLAGEGRTGDCWRACIASLIDLPCSEVPHFVEECSAKCENWEDETKEWLLNRGFFMGMPLIAKRYDGSRVLFLRRDGERTIEIQSGYLMVCGKSPRGIGHAVLANAEKWLKVGFRAEPRGDKDDDCSLWLAHDPHPSRAGLFTWHEAYAIIPA